MRRASQDVYRWLTLLAVVFVVLLIGTGGWVRLSESGLGCPTWPNCFVHHLAAHDTYHSLVEFSNRCVIIAVGVIVVLVLLGAMRRAERRRSLWLALGLLAGYVGEAVLGGLTVLFKLAPELVAAHLVLAMALLVDAVVLHWRVSERGADDGKARLVGLGPRLAGSPERRPVASEARSVGPEARWLGRLLLAVVGLTIVLGTVATGSGPYAGTADTPRLPFRFSSAVELHAVVGVFFFGLIVALGFMLSATKAPARVRKAHIWVLVAAALQGAIGYVQYFGGLPIGLVEAHIAGGGLLLIAVLRLNLVLGDCATPQLLPTPHRKSLAGVIVSPPHM